MKIIDLLNKIANGEEVPKKIKYANIIYVARYFEDGKLFEYVDITNEEEHFSYYCVPVRLNDEVEIIEEEKKIPEKLYKYMEKEEEGCFENILQVYDGGEYEITEDMSFVIDKINEIIDYLKSKGDE